MVRVNKRQISTGLLVLAAAGAAGLIIWPSTHQVRQESLPPTSSLHQPPFAPYLPWLGTAGAQRPPTPPVVGHWPAPPAAAAPPGAEPSPITSAPGRGTPGSPAQPGPPGPQSPPQQSSPATPLIGAMVGTPILDVGLGVG